MQAGLCLEGPRHRPKRRPRLVRGQLPGGAGPACAPAPSPAASLALRMGAGGGCEGSGLGRPLDAGTAPHCAHSVRESPAGAEPGGLTRPLALRGAVPSLQTREKYEKALKELDQGTPQYMENMEQVFEQCQQFEEKRLRFFREVLLEVQKHLDLSNVAK